ncbi:pyridoxamine 5'-phosphate oxidase family protein [Streptomyces sp. NBC_00286]|uniref:pyridoxamine 5'-phosphate oxidase family protein n=1 Tax=Streptomyces sp. NBC_00286 TaxID=2975701 RepID=UPI002E286103|nr:pyridoxamine 5'-phosphate oxidase family protein [Streptomyces sp. NBC_00286]
MVLYEADHIDTDTHTGWSVTVTGLATAVSDPQDQARYEAQLQPWVAARMNHVVRITPEFITGYRLHRAP